MSNFYDPWAHAVNLLLTRIMQFAALSALLSLAIWAGLLHWWFDASWEEVPRSTWAMVSGTTSLHWRVHLGMCALVSAILVAWLFTTATLLCRLRSGERHHRGSRVVNYERD